MLSIVMVMGGWKAATRHSMQHTQRRQNEYFYPGSCYRRWPCWLYDCHIVSSRGLRCHVDRERGFPTLSHRRVIAPIMFRGTGPDWAREKVEKHGFQRKDGGYFAWGKDSWELDFSKLRH